MCIYIRGIHHQGREGLDIIYSGQRGLTTLLSNRPLLIIRCFPMRETGRHLYSCPYLSGGNLDKKPTKIKRIVFTYQVTGRITAILPACAFTDHHFHGGSFRDQVNVCKIIGVGLDGTRDER